MGGGGTRLPATRAGLRATSWGKEAHASDPGHETAGKSSVTGVCRVSPTDAGVARTGEYKTEHWIVGCSRPSPFPSRPLTLSALPAMSSVVETRKASPVQASAPKPKATKEEVPADQNIPDNYVSWTLKNQKPLPPLSLDNLLQNIQWLTLIILTLTPTIAIYGLCTVKLQWKTFVWSIVYYFITGLGTSHSGFCVPRKCFDTLYAQASLRGTIDCGLTARITRRSRSNTSSPWRALALSKAQLSGGAVATAPTIATPTPTLTRTTRTRDSSSPTSAGCSSSPATSPVLPTSAT